MTGRHRYAELHAHSAYSFLDGANEPDDLASAAVELGLEALALTDHDGVPGIVKHAQAGRAHGLPTIHGTELTLADGSHLPVLARNPTGYRQLVTAISRHNLDAGQRREPAHDLPTLASALRSESTGQTEAAAGTCLVLTGTANGPLRRALGDPRRPDTWDLKAADTCLGRLTELFAAPDRGRPFGAGPTTIAHRQVEGDAAIGLAVELTLDGGPTDAALTDAQVKRLAAAAPLPTRALFDTGYHGARSYRIPSLLTLDSGVILAGADQRVSIPNDAPNDINLVMRRSLDGGATWEEMRTLLSLPGTGALGASLIDSVLVQDRSTGRVICLVDQFPGGIGQPNATVGTGFDEQGRRVLHNRAGELFAVEPDGSVVTQAGEATDYRVILRGDDAAGVRAGDVLLGGRAVGSIYLAHEQAPEDCLFQHRGSHLLMLTSDDDGATWSEPIDITAQVKADWMCFLGTGPGNAIQLTAPEHAGRILAPVYYSHEAGGTAYLSCAAIYSDDGGTTWTLGASPNDGREVLGAVVHSRDLADERASLYESVLVEGTDGAVHVWARNQHPSGRVAHAVSHDGGVTWGEVDYDEQLPEIFSQPNAIAITGLEGAAAVGDGDGVKGAVGRGIVFANASRMLPFRGCGVLRLSYDDGATWPHNRVINPRHYVYQCMAQLPSGDIALLWEREWQGLFLTTVPLAWLTSSRSTIS